MSQPDFLDLIVIDDDPRAVEQLASQLKDQGLVVRHKIISNELQLRRELSRGSPQIVLANCRYSQLPLPRVSELALHSGVELPMIAIDPDTFCDAAALEALNAGACSYGRRENTAYLAKLIEEQLRISETWTMISNYQGQISSLETQGEAELQATDAAIAYLIDGIIYKTNQGFRDALASSQELSGYPISEFLRRTDNVAFMRTLRRAMRGESLEASSQDDILLTLTNGSRFSGNAQLKASTINGERCSQLILSHLVQAPRVTDHEQLATSDSQDLHLTDSTTAVLNLSDLAVPELSKVIASQNVAALNSQEPNNVVSINDMDLDAALAFENVDVTAQSSATAADSGPFYESSSGVSSAGKAPETGNSASPIANDDVVLQTELSVMIDAAISAREISPEWRSSTVLNGSRSIANTLFKLSIRVTDAEGTDWLLDRADDGLPKRQKVQLDQWAVRQALRASNADEARGDWLVPLSPEALKPRFLKWLDNKLEGRNSQNNRRIIFCVSESCLVLHEDAFHNLGKTARKHECGVSLEEIRDTAHCSNMLTLLQQEERFPTEYLILNSEVLLSGCDGLQPLLAHCSSHNIVTLADNPQSTDAFARLWSLGVNFVVGGNTDTTVVEVEHALDAHGISQRASS